MTQRFESNTQRVYAPERLKYWSPSQTKVIVQNVTGTDFAIGVRESDNALVVTLYPSHDPRGAVLESADESPIQWNHQLLDAPR